MPSSCSARAFQRAQAGRAHRDDAAAPARACVQPRGGVRVERRPFRMHAVLRRCPPPSPAGTSQRRHAASRARARYPCASKRGEQVRREMQAGGRRGDRTFVPRKDGLIVRRHRAHRPRACPRYRAAAASRLRAAMAASSAAPAKDRIAIRLHHPRRAQSLSHRAFPTATHRPPTVCAPVWRRRESGPASTRLCSVTSIFGPSPSMPARAARRPDSRAGMTFVSLRTSASPRFR